MRPQDGEGRGEVGLAGRARGGWVGLRGKRWPFERKRDVAGLDFNRVRPRGLQGKGREAAGGLRAGRAGGHRVQPGCGEAAGGGHG